MKSQSRQLGLLHGEQAWGPACPGFPPTVLTGVPVLGFAEFAGLAPVTAVERESVELVEDDDDLTAVSVQMSRYF